MTQNVNVNMSLFLIQFSSCFLYNLDLIQLSSGDKPALRAACMGAIFEIYDSKLPEEVTGSTETEVPATEESSEEMKTPSSHIMISYRWENPSKIVMREFKDQLKARGYNVWMDEDFMGEETFNDSLL